MRSSTATSTPTSPPCARSPPRPAASTLALANHLVMGPAILARAGVSPFAVKIHGSALEYTVKPHPRFLPYAYEGHGGGRRRPRRLPPHRRVPLGGDARPRRSEEQDAPRAPGCRRDRVPSVRVSRTVDRLRRQADRLQGRGPPARGLAAGPRGPPRRAPAGRRLRRVRGRVCGGCWRRSSAATSTAPARSRGWGGGSRAGRRVRCGSSPPSSPTRRPGYAEQARAAAGLGRVHRPARARRGRRAARRGPRRW